MEVLNIGCMKLCQTRTRGLVLAMGAFASIVLVFWLLSLNTQIVTSPLFPLRESSLSSNSMNSTNSAVAPEVVEDMNVGKGGIGVDNIDSEDDFKLDRDGDPDAKFPVELANNESNSLKNGGEQNNFTNSNTSIAFEDVGTSNNGSMEEKIIESNTTMIELDGDKDPDIEFPVEIAKNESNSLKNVGEQNNFTKSNTSIVFDDVGTSNNGSMEENVIESNITVIELDGDEDPDVKFPVEIAKNESNSLKNVGEQYDFTKSNTSIVFEDVGASNNGSIEEKITESNTTTNTETKGNGSLSPPPAMASVVYVNANGTSTPDVRDTASLVDQEKGMISKGDDLGTLKNSCDIVLEKKKKRRNQANPPVTMSEMNDMLLQNCASLLAKKPRWSSVHDEKLLDIKTMIKNAPIVRADRELHVPAFRNISMFKRSYDLMEQTLKIYVYKDGSKPIFHQGPLKGIYASEGWFMKLMEGNRQYAVKDPKKANLFYLPLSSRNLELSLYDSNLHSKQNLVDHLESYVDRIAAKYPFWNRTGGTDHFLVASHDWAPYETRRALRNTIRALCNADITDGFKIGKDVSLPETYIRIPRNPLKDLGERPANARPILAFFAGQMHGPTRPILVQHWSNKDPEMKIFGPMAPTGDKGKPDYIKYMKSSKYCLCPRGYEVNSPRVVEAIFFECVPVLMSDNYVPPFFEVLNWDAFSVTVEEKDIPRLKEILSSIPKKKYLELQNGVKKVQQHFLWHNKPVKYDLFHMILHSVWFNRLNQIRR